MSLQPPGSKPGWGGKLLLMVFVLTVLEGAVRKWVVPGWPMGRYAAYFSKDVVFVLAGLAGMDYAGRLSRRYANFVIAFSVFFILPPSLLNLPNSNIVGAVLSFRAYSLIPWCAFLAAGTIRSWRDIDWIIGVFGILAIGVAILGMVQFNLPRGHFLNRYDASDASVVYQYGHVRAVGTFSYIAGMASMAGASAWAGMYFFFSSPRPIRRLFGAVVAGSGVVSGLVSMSRSGFLPAICIIVVAPFCFRKGKEFLYVLLFLAAGYWVLSTTDPPDSSMEPGFYRTSVRRFEESDTFSSRFAYTVQDTMIGVTGYPFGTGLGLGQPGGYAAEGARPQMYYVESEMGRIAMEVGILGLLGVMLIRFLPLQAVARVLWLSTNRRMRALTAASLPFLLLAAVTNLAFNHTLSSFFWAAVAVVFGAMRLRGVSDLSPKRPQGRPPLRRRAPLREAR